MDLVKIYQAIQRLNDIIYDDLTTNSLANRLRETRQLLYDYAESKETEEKIREALNNV